MNITVMLILCILVAVAAFSYAVWLFKWVKTQPQDNKTIEKVCGLIQDGARTFFWALPFVPPSAARSALKSPRAPTAAAPSLPKKI